MVEIRHLRHVVEELGGGLMARTYLWKRVAEDVRDFELRGFVARQRTVDDRRKARREVDGVLMAIREAIAAGTLQSARVERMRPLCNDFTQDDFFDALRLMSLPRAQAVRFALHADMSLADVVGLRWRAARALAKDDPQALAVLRERPRHIRTDLVFWEQIGKRVQPLISLEAHWIVVSCDVSWETAREVLRDKVLIDFEADFELLKEAARRDLSKSPLTDEFA